MLVDDVETFLPDGGATLYTAELASKQSIESVQMMLGPANTRACHHAREALLIDADSVFDERKVDVGNLENVEWEITLEDAGPM